jgi:NAD(P)-dependent dehydrogenase (short-subunit alcohol dehydrogenase family)
MSKPFDGRIVVITGAASAERFAKEGAQVIVTDIDATAGEALAERIGGDFLRVDVTREAEVEAVVRFAVERYGRIDCMINNAGLVGAVGSLLETDACHWHATLAVLLDSVFYGIKHVAKPMRERGSGVILNVSSIAGLMGGLGPHVYTAAKHAVIGLTRSAASELSQYGIRVNAIAPGTTVTPLVETIRGSREAALSGAAAVSPLGTALMPEEIAAGLVYLASDAAAHITAHTLVVDSGVTGMGVAAGASVLKSADSRFIGSAKPVG